MTLRITAVDHVGVRVADADRSIAFYATLGFRVVARSDEAPVVILRNDAGVEINLVVNADAAHDGRNVLMDDGLPKHAGYTHVALRVGPLDEVVTTLGALGIAISEGPVRLGGARSLFVRDPDRNVIELREA